MFSSSRSKDTCAIVIDIGSSSVGISIVVNHVLQEMTEVVWSHRAHCLINDGPASIQPTKEIQTAVRNAFLKLSQSGLPLLQKRKLDEKISEVVSVIAAPWSYTITKTIGLSDDNSFVVTKKLLEELITAAKKQADTTFQANALTETLSLKMEHEDIINVRINGYAMIDPIDQRGSDVSVTHLQVAIASDLMDSLNESINKVVPNVPHTAASFMYSYYLTLINMRPNTSEMCLVDVTGEKTELGIVRDGILQQSTYTDMGSYTLARNIAKKCKVPYEEAHAYLKEDPEELSEKLNKKAVTEIKAVLKEYQENISTLFKGTGDALSIPKSIFLHTDARTEEFFIEQIKRGAERATGHPHNVHPFTSKVVSSVENGDTALLLAQHFYARKDEYVTLLPQNI